MNIVVLIKLVPDLIEEIEIDESGKALDTTFMRLIINEPDEHALEQASLLRLHGGCGLRRYGRHPIRRSC